MTEAIRVRRGNLLDISQVRELADANNSPHWTESDYLRIFTHPRYLFVAQGPAGIVGFLVVNVALFDWELENVVVKTEWQRQGIAKRLIEAMISLGQRRGRAKSIFLEVRESNFAAKHLYESCGFQPYGRRESYYVNPSEDAVLYRFQCNPKSLENC